MFPVIGGHEGSGIVESVGDGVHGARARRPRRDVVHPVVRAGASTALSGRQYICDLGATHAGGPDDRRRHLAPPPGRHDLNRMCQLGTFSEYIVVHEASLIRIEPWFDLRAAALISCGISTGFGSAVNRGGVRPGDTVAVIGCGGVGSGAHPGRAPPGPARSSPSTPMPSKVERALKHRRHPRLRRPRSTPRSRSCPSSRWGKNCDVVIITVDDVDRPSSLEQARSITAKGGVVVVTSLAPFGQIDRSTSNVFSSGDVQPGDPRHGLRLGEPAPAGAPAAAPPPRGHSSTSTTWSRTSTRSTRSSRATRTSSRGQHPRRRQVLRTRRAARRATRPTTA